MSDRYVEEIRSLLVAFQDTTVWCDQVMQLAHRFVRVAQGADPPSHEEIADAIRTLVNAERYLATEREAVMRIRKRVGLSPGES